MRAGDYGIANDAVHGWSCAHAANSEPRRQIRQPLRRGIHERCLHALVDARQYECAEDDEERAESHFHDLARREDSRAPALHSLARGETDAEQRQRRPQPEREHGGGDLGQLATLCRQ